MCAKVDGEILFLQNEETRVILSVKSPQFSIDPQEDRQQMGFCEIISLQRRHLELNRYLIFNDNLVNNKLLRSLTIDIYLPTRSIRLGMTVKTGN